MKVSWNSISATRNYNLVSTALRSLIPTIFERISARITDYISESVGGFDAEVASLLGGLQLPEEAHARPDAEKRASRSAPRRRGAAR